MRRPLAGLISFAQRLAAGQVVLSIESVVLLASLFFALFCNSLFLSGMLDGYDMAQPGSWLEAFCRDAQTVLLAELDLRLKPVSGLIAALAHTKRIPDEP